MEGSVQPRYGSAQWWWFLAAGRKTASLPIQPLGIRSSIYYQLRYQLYYVWWMVVTSHDPLSIFIPSIPSIPSILGMHDIHKHKHKQQPRDEFPRSDYTKPENRDPLGLHPPPWYLCIKEKTRNQPTWQSTYSLDLHELKLLFGLFKKTFFFSFFLVVSRLSTLSIPSVLLILTSWSFILVFLGGIKIYTPSLSLMVFGLGRIWI